MKSATVILLAVTVFTLFLESSTAPADSTASETSLDLDVAVRNDQTQQQARTSLSGIIKSLIVSGAITKVTNKIETLISNVGAIVKDINDKGDVKEDITINIDESDKQEISNLLETSEQAQARTRELVADALPKAKGEAKKAMTKVSEWLQYLDDLSSGVHQEARAVLASGSVRALLKVVSEASVNIEEVKVDVVRLSEILPIGPVKAVFVKEMKLMLDSAIAANDLLKGLLAVPL